MIAVHMFENGEYIHDCPKMTAFPMIGSDCNQAEIRHSQNI